MMRYRFPSLFRIKQKFMDLKNLKIIPLWYQQRLQKHRFWKELSKYCHDKTLLCVYKKEFADIEAALKGDEFLSFIRRNAPDLIKY